MYYLLVLLLAVILYYVFVKIVGSLVKGCFMIISAGILFSIIWIFLKSTKEPVNLFGLYTVDNFKIVRNVK